MYYLYESREVKYVFLKQIIIPILSLGIHLFSKYSISIK